MRNTKLCHVPSTKIKRTIPRKNSSSRAVRRQLEIIDRLEWVTTCQPVNCSCFLRQMNLRPKKRRKTSSADQRRRKCVAEFHIMQRCRHSIPPCFAPAAAKISDRLAYEFGENSLQNIAFRRSHFNSSKLPFHSACLREKGQSIDSRNQWQQSIIQASDIKGIDSLS